MQETHRGIPRSANNDQNEEDKENQTPDPKSDLKNCLTYVKNQCGQHIAKEMADLLAVSRATFFRKIKGLVIDQESKENKECEFLFMLERCTTFTFSAPFNR